MKCTFASIAVLAMLFAGCSTTVVRDEPKPIAVAEGAQLDMLAVAEALLEMNGTIVQGVSGSWKENAFAAEFVIKGDGGKTVIAVLAPAMRLATITLERPHSIRYERARRIPAAFEPEYVLFDIAAVNLGTEELARALGPRFTVFDDGSNRVISLKAEKPGARNDPVAVLERNADGTMRFVNLKRSYEYTIANLK